MARQSRKRAKKEGPKVSNKKDEPVEEEAMEAAEAKSVSEQAAIDAEALFDTPDQGQVSNDSAASESVSDK